MQGIADWAAQRDQLQAEQFARLLSTLMGGAELTSRLGESEADRASRERLAQQEIESSNVWKKLGLELGEQNRQKADERWWAGEEGRNTRSANTTEATNLRAAKQRKTSSVNTDKRIAASNARTARIESRAATVRAEADAKATAKQDYTSKRQNIRGAMASLKEQLTSIKKIEEPTTTDIARIGAARKAYGQLESALTELDDKKFLPPDRWQEIAAITSATGDASKRGVAWFDIGKGRLPGADAMAAPTMTLETLARYKEMYPDKTEAELIEAYKKTFGKK